MANVVFPDQLSSVTGGVRETVVPAANFRELLLALESRWPGAADTLSKYAVAIDGHIYQDAFLEPLSESSEVFFLQRIEGG